MTASSPPSGGNRGKTLAVTRVQMKGDWYPDLVRVFYNNLKNVNGDIQLRVKGVNIYIDNNVWLQVAGLKAEEKGKAPRIKIDYGDQGF
ncbi:hypothetical protein LR48_Vigan10g195900 [Vigna angularis]|uniref:Uncharacterized protein n=1 Tax=Phaseolus angularis TaxID=3914 RepID=A0A0L9VMG3_PHAAN|nr:hypothetical protein LR48_Vigan10g195900 [Vigna angularis]